MSQLTQLIQGIATAVNARLTLTMSQRIAALSSQMQSASRSWIDRSSASSPAQPTGQSTWSDRSTASAGIRAAAMARSHELQLERSGNAITHAEGRRNELQSKHTAVRNIVDNEIANPTGMDPEVLAHFADSADAYRAQLDDATLVLQKVTSEQESLKAAIKKQVDNVHSLSKEDLEKLASASKTTGTAASTRDSLQKRRDSLQDKLTEAVTNPGSLSQKSMQKMALAIGKYDTDLQKADEVLKRSTDAERKLQDETILAASLKAKANARARAKEERETKDAQRRRDVAQDAADERHGIRRPSGLFPGSNRPPSPMGQRLRNLHTGLKRLMGRGGRKAFSGINNRIRAALNPQWAKTKAANARSGLLSANSVRDKANAAFKQAAAEHAKSVAWHARDPGNASKSALAQSGSKLASTQSAMNVAGQAAKAASSEAAAAEGLASIAGAAEGLAVAAGPAGIALAVVGAAVGVAIAGFQTFQKVVSTAKAEIERYRQERSTFSAQVAGSLIQYDQQSRNLESRSSRATSGSASDVVKATMGLREALQPLSEKYENIMNQMLSGIIMTATNITTLATAIETVVADKVGGGVKMVVDVAHEMAKMLPFIGKDVKQMLDKVKEVEKKIPPPKIENTGVQMMQQFFNLNHNNLPAKKAPPLPPVR